MKATDDDLRDYLHQGQLGQIIFPNGNYSQEAYEDLVSRNGYTVPQFESLLKEEILINKIRSLISSGASVTDAEVRDQFNKTKHQGQVRLRGPQERRHPQGPASRRR